MTSMMKNDDSNKDKKEKEEEELDLEDEKMKTSSNGDADASAGGDVINNSGHNNAVVPSNMNPLPIGGGNGFLEPNMALPEPMPLPEPPTPATGRRDNAGVQVGAFRRVPGGRQDQPPGAGGEDDDDLDYEEYSVGNNNPPPPPPPSRPRREGENLVEATPVSVSSEFPQPPPPPSGPRVVSGDIDEIEATGAKILPEESKESSTFSTKNKLICLVIALAIIGLAIFGIVYGFTSSGSSKSNSSTSESNSTASTTSTTSTPTITPTMTPTMAPTNYALDLPPYSLDLIESDPVSVPALAYQWILDNYGYDKYSQMPQYRKEQIFVLVCFLHAFDATQMPGVLLSSVIFNTSLHECDWDNTHLYVSCTPEPERILTEMGITTSPSKIFGVIPQEVALLTSLQRFWMNNLNFVGNLSEIVPSTFTELSTILTYYSMENNRVYGPIPSTLYEMTKLSVLDLRRNKITGTISSNLGSLRALEILDLSTNRFSGTIPTTIGLLTQLNSTNWSQMKQLNGTIPTEIGLLNHLTNLHLHRSDLSGVIPSQLGLLTNLERLQLHGNPNLSGTVPQSVCALSTNGTKLTVNDCPKPPPSSSSGGGDEDGGGGKGGGGNGNGSGSGRGSSRNLRRSLQRQNNNNTNQAGTTIGGNEVVNANGLVFCPADCICQCGE